MMGQELGTKIMLAPDRPGRVRRLLHALRRLKSVSTVKHFLIDNHPPKQILFSRSGSTLISGFKSPAQGVLGMLSPEVRHPGPHLQRKIRWSKSMYCNSTVGSSPLGLSRRLFAHGFRSVLTCLVVLCGLIFGGLASHGQSTVGGGIQGTVSDPDGRPVAKATVTATNTDTGVASKTLTGSAGNYSIQPLQAGPYIVEVEAKGFQRLLQQNVTVDNTSVLGIPLKLSIGGESQTITVTDAPAQLDTTDATLGGTIENELYSSLPLTMNAGPRDPTAFQYLMPGVQENPAGATGDQALNGNSGIFSGTGQTNLNENYIEGVPVSNVSQQGSSNPISGAVSVDAVDQFSVQTSGASTSFSGAGSTNYTIKTGGNQYHGGVFDIIRNTMFDTWGYFSKVPLASTGFAVKPGEHQNSYGGTLGGPILKDKLFFFGSYEGFHYTATSNTPRYITIPTAQERLGNFTDLFGTTTPGIFNPVVGSFPPPSRAPFQGLLNGVPTYNVIDPQYMSSISTYLQSALPTPTNLSTFNNYLASLPKENSDYKVTGRLDYTINQRNKVSVVALGGNIGFGGQPFYQSQQQLPIPYADGTFTNQKTATGILTYVYIASQSMINSLKYSYTRNWGQGFSLTAGRSNPHMRAPENPGTPQQLGPPIVPNCPPGNENACAAGINNLPPGMASASMPSISFAHNVGPSSEPTGWASRGTTGPSATNTYYALDELQVIRGRHNIKLGASIEWLQANGAAYGGYSRPLSLTYNDETTEGGTTGFTGDAYASFLVGAVTAFNVQTQSIQDLGGRFRQPALYIQDNWQASPKLTLNLGLRYDYLQPYHEVKNRITFLNVNKQNPITGNMGVQEYAGFPDIKNFTDIPANKQLGTPAETAAQQLALYAPYICHCTTPVHPYNKNFEPRLGFAYAYNGTTVISGGFSLNLTRAGGAGGGSSSTVGGSASVKGTGNNAEFNGGASQSQGGSTSDPLFFLNPGVASLTPPSQAAQFGQGTQTPPLNNVPGQPVPCVANNTCSVLSNILPWTAPGANVNPLSTTGNYNYQSAFPDKNNDAGCNAAGIFCPATGIVYADPYYGGRGPQFLSYNMSIQKLINKKAVLTIAYSGTQTHFLPGGSGRGTATNSISPDTGQQYKASLAGSDSGQVPVPYPLFAGPNATVAAALRPFPQYGGLSDLWGDTGNANYNSIQISVVQRVWHNLQGTANYTRAKEIDDTGNHRTQFPIGPQDGNFYRNYTANQIDRSLGTSTQTNAINVTWSYIFPIGRGQAFFATNRIAGLIGGGWQLSGIYKYRDGFPLQITQSGGCAPQADDLQGTCMPDYTPGFDKRRARINGRWGRGPGMNAANAGTIQYLNQAAFQCPDSSPQNNGATCGSGGGVSNTFKIGNIARTAPDGLHGPGYWDVDLGVRRTFHVRETATLHLTFQLTADVTNATNSTFFNTGGTGWSAGSTSFGTVNSQNQNVLPRDWQFGGRFTF
jgi:hypothetical protein